MRTILIINWLIYGALFLTFFIKLTDEKERDYHRKIAYALLMFCCLFFSVMLFKESFVFDKQHIRFNIIETIFNFLILLLMWTKIKEDKMFDKLKKNKK